jgi:hypothetical protein
MTTTASLRSAARRSWKACLQKPFPLLVHLFVGRIFHGSEGDGELDLSLGLVLSLLALPGGFYSILLFNKYGSLLQWMRGQQAFDPLYASLPDEYFFIVLSMVVTGAVAVWHWDRVFPDRRDFANLVPLPLSTRVIFLANLAAILFLAGMLAFVVNAASCFLFPLVVSGSQETFAYFFDFFTVHLLVVVSASVFSFFAVFCVVGGLMTVLPYNVYRRVSVFVRAGIVACFVALLSTSFAVPSLLDNVNRSSIRFLPSVWFLGLCSLARGRADPLAALGSRAILALLCSVFIALAVYALSYSRYFKRIPETLDVSSGSAHRCSSWFFSLMDRTVLRSPFQRAGYRFLLRTLARSERHSLVLGVFIGIGLVVASQALFAALNHGSLVSLASPSAAILSAPFIFIYCLAVGLRFVFEIPTDLRSNWIFRFLLDKTHHECIPLARKVMMTFVLPTAIVVVLPLHAWLWGWTSALLHATIIIFASLLLDEILLVRFHKLPFTCSYPPFRDSAIVHALSYVLGFFVFVFPIAQFESWGLLHPSSLLLLVPLGAAAWYSLSRFRAEAADPDDQLIFEEIPPTRFEVLDLSR